MSSGNVQYLLWRRDDNGNDVVICRFHSRQQAERIRRRYQERDAKRVYRITLLQPGALR